MSEQIKPEGEGGGPDEQEGPKQKSRRDFLRSLGRWSAIIIGGVTLGGMMEGPGEADAAGWINGRGGGGSAGWVNRGGGGGAAWVNGGGGGGAGWVNRGGGWVNGGGGGWVNRRGSWINRF